MHVAAIRSSLVERHPWLAGNVLAAFEKSKQMSLQRLANFGAAKRRFRGSRPRSKRPWRSCKDYWPYGVEPNRAALETMTRSRSSRA